jgi:hypothetical protein
MKLTYENMKKFLEMYFEYYNKYSQNPETIHKMDECWGEDFKSTAYFYRNNGPTPIEHSSGSQFRDMICQVHQKISEKLTPSKILIDEKKKEAAVLLHVEKEVIATGEKAFFTGIAIYSLGLDENKKIKLKSLDICIDNPEKLTGMWKY